VTQLSDLRPGDVFVTPTYGSNLLDRFVGSGIRFMTATRDDYGRWHNAKVNHTGMYVGDGLIVEAAPRGARLAPWDSYGSDATWSVNGLGTRTVTGTLRPLALSDADRQRISDAARTLLGTPYGFLDILAIAFAQKRLDSRLDVTRAIAQQPWWVRRIASMNTLICSQLVDVAFLTSGAHLYDDGRLPGLVSPADIYGLFL